jgi:hypothetical protein
LPSNNLVHREGPAFVIFLGRAPIELFLIEYRRGGLSLT